MAFKNVFFILLPTTYVIKYCITRNNCLVCIPNNFICCTNLGGHLKHDLKFFLGLEIQVWEALKNGDKNADSNLLSDDFLGVYETGLSSKEDHLELLRNGPIISCYEIGSSQLIQLGPEIASLTYSATATFLKNEEQDAQVLLYITSIWARRLNKWVNIFSQDTKGNAHY